MTMSLTTVEFAAPILRCRYTPAFWNCGVQWQSTPDLSGAVYVFADLDPVDAMHESMRRPRENVDVPRRSSNTLCLVLSIYPISPDDWNIPQ